MRLHLIRHGQTPSNVIGAIDTSVPGPPLNDKGEQQIVALADALEDVAFDRVLASSQLRAQMTAAPLAHRRGLEVEVHDGLREISGGELEMRTDDEAVERYLTMIAAWGAGPTTLTVAGGETREECLGRFDAIIDALVAGDSKHAAVVSHGAMIRVWCAARVSNITAEYAFAHGLANTGIITVHRTDAGEWVASEWESYAVPVREDSSGPAGEPTNAASHA